MTEFFLEGVYKVSILRSGCLAFQSLTNGPFPRSYTQDPHRQWYGDWKLRGNQTDAQEKHLLPSAISAEAVLYLIRQSAPS